MSNGIVYSVVVPLYNKELVINESYKKLKAVMDTSMETYEILFVNDGSSDLTRYEVENICRKDKNIKLINLSRNYGHKAAMTAGIDEAVGDAVITIDGNLQNSLKNILDMIKKWKEGCDVVYGQIVKREEKTFFKKFLAKVISRMIRSFTKRDNPVNTGGLRLIDRKVCYEINSLPEHLYIVDSKVSYNELKNSAIFIGNRSSGLYDKVYKKIAG